MHEDLNQVLGGGGGASIIESSWRKGHLNQVKKC